MRLCGHSKNMLHFTPTANAPFSSRLLLALFYVCRCEETLHSMLPRCRCPVTSRRPMSSPAEVALRVLASMLHIPFSSDGGVCQNALKEEISPFRCRCVSSGSHLDLGVDVSNNGFLGRGGGGRER